MKMKAYSTENAFRKIDGIDIPDWPGAYMIPHYRIKGYYFQVICGNGMGWDHVSVCLRDKSFNANKFVKRTCTWQEMCWIKNWFFDESEVVIQYHPAETEYVNIHDFVLHLWRPQNELIPVPETIMV